MGEEFVNYTRAEGEDPRWGTDYDPEPREADELEPTRPLKYRLSPNATFMLSRTPFEQNFSEAPWNLRRLLGFAGQRTPGMGISNMEFELLYGLTTSITRDFLKLAELRSRLGNLPADLRYDKPPLRLVNTDDEDQFVNHYHSVCSRL